MMKTKLKGSMPYGQSSFFLVFWGWWPGVGTLVLGWSWAHDLCRTSRVAEDPYTICPLGVQHVKPSLTLSTKPIHLSPWWWPSMIRSNPFPFDDPSMMMTRRQSMKISIPWWFHSISMRPEQRSTWRWYAIMHYLEDEERSSHPTRLA